jgi:DNA mismatch repair protein MutL
MSVIHELSEEVRTQIAAGEVIERPAYIVKELVENAIDAGATKIIVKADDGGLSKIIVADDGRGMERVDLELCYKPFTTSKITTFDDLTHVVSMGFRGEALASIAAVSTLTIRSRMKDMLFGNEIVIKDGIFQGISKKGMPVGTQVVVDRIFESVPARHKFVSSGKSEYRLLVELMMRYGLSYPDIEIEFIHDGKQVSYYKKNAKEVRLKEVVGIEIAEFLLPLSYEKDQITIDGYISKPQLSYSSARNQYIFINNRFIKISSIVSSIRDSYSTLLEPSRHPFVVLYISLPPHYIDINVHPRKEKAHFYDEKSVFEALRESVKKVLASEKMYYYDKRWEKKSTEKPIEWHIRDGGTNTYAGALLKEELPSTSSLLAPTEKVSLFQYHNLYIILETKKGLLFIDQHAAHERIIYERLLESWKKRKESQSSYILEKPLKMLLNAVEVAAISEHFSYFGQMGFCIDLKENSIIIRAVPEIWKDREIKSLIRGLVDELSEKTSIEIDTVSRKMIAYIACRSAIKAGDKLTVPEMEQLLEKLNNVENKATCPHGRPIQVEMPLSYLHRLFKRN